MIENDLNYESNDLGNTISYADIQKSIFHKNGKAELINNRIPEIFSVKSVSLDFILKKIGRLL